MELKDQVVNLELSQRLKELGEPQDSYWWWYIGPYSNGKWDIIDCKSDYAYETDRCYSAPTVSELGERLPDGYITKRLGKRWIGAGFGIEDWTIIADTEANARAKMRIYLLENKLIKEE